MIRDILTSPPGTRVTFRGHVREFRTTGKLCFIKVTDYPLVGIQVVWKAPSKAEAKAVHRRAYIEVHGTLVECEPGREQTHEIQATAVTVIQACPLEEYPIPKTDVTLDLLRENPSIKPQTLIIQALTVVKSSLFQAIHLVLGLQGFNWIQTPIITTSDCEGAGEAFSVQAPNCKEFFSGKQVGLTVSGQLHLEPYAHALGRVYCFGPSFRAEKSLTRRHAAEFWMLEPEMRDVNLNEMMGMIETFINDVISAVRENCYAEIGLLQYRFGGQLLPLPFSRITYTQAVEEINAHPDFSIEWGEDLGTEMEKYLCSLHGPVFVYDYPASLKSFYMYQNDDGKTVACCDLLWPGIGEIIGGSQREHRHENLIAAMVARNMNLESYKWYTDTRKFGGPPTSGYGLGFDRLVRVITNAPSISDLMPYGVRYKHVF